MRFVITFSMMVCVFASPSPAIAQDLLPPVQATHGGLLQAGLAALSAAPAAPRPEDAAFMAVQLQPTKLKTDRKTKIIMISLIAAAAVVTVIYALHHMEGNITFH